MYITKKKDDIHDIYYKCMIPRLIGLPDWHFIDFTFITSETKNMIQDTDTFLKICV